jgi:hypothetical protein
MINELFKTPDLALAAFLSLNFQLEDIDKSNSRRALFYFQRSNELDEAIGMFWSGKGLVDAKQYFSELRVLKSRLYSRDY